MDAARRQEILARGRPDYWGGAEPGLGGWYTEEEVEAAISTIRASMDWRVGFGFYCEEIVEFEQNFAKYCGTADAVSITSAGAGLDMAMRALDLEPGDEVISPAFNFMAGHYAVIGAGAKLVLSEIDPDTLCMDPADVERRITPNTRAILATHMNGLSADMDALIEVGERHPHPKHGPIPVIGDVARACGAEYKGTKVGKKGWMNIFSFHTMKLMTTLGEGGMITTDDPALARRMRAIRMWGWDTEEFWGGNYKLTKVQAAVGLVQLRRLDEMLAARYARAKERDALLAEVPELTLPCEPPGYKHTYYIYSMLVPVEWQGAKRDRLREMLSDDYGVVTSILNPPPYEERPFLRNHLGGQRCPLTEEISRRLFCPYLHGLMPAQENEYVAAAIAEAVERVKAEG